MRCYPGLLPRLQDMVAGCRHLLAPDGRFLAMKGVYPEQELAAVDGV